MAYITIKQNGKEMGWRELMAPVIIGRQRECDLSLPDTQLSRSHCRIEPGLRGWVVVDLGSKNGTWVDGQRATRAELSAQNVLQVGRCTIALNEGRPPRIGRFQSRTTNRPADPSEALADTVMGMTVVPKRPADPWSAMARRSTPRPIPRPVGCDETGSFPALLELPPEMDRAFEPVLSRPRLARGRPFPKPILLEIPDLMEERGGVAVAIPSPDLGEWPMIESPEIEGFVSPEIAWAAESAAPRAIATPVARTAPARMRRRWSNTTVMDACVIALLLSVTAVVGYSAAGLLMSI